MSPRSPRNNAARGAPWAGWVPGYAADVVDDRVLLVAAFLELALLVQVVTGIAQGAGRSGGWEKGVFFAYLLSVPLVVPGAVLLAIKEKSRFGMAVVLAAAAVVAVFVARLVQIWGPYA